MYEQHDRCLIRNNNCLPFASTCVHSRFLCCWFFFVVSVLLIFLVFCVVLLCVFTFSVQCREVCYDFRIKTVFGSSLPLVVCRKLHVLFALFVFAFVQWCPTYIVLCLCFVCLRPVYPMLPVSLDCPFLIAPLVFANVQLFFSVDIEKISRYVVISGLLFQHYLCLL